MAGAAPNNQHNATRTRRRHCDSSLQRLPVTFVATLRLLLLCNSPVSASMEFSPPADFLSLSATAARLSALAYEDANDFLVDDVGNDQRYYHHDDYEEIIFFTEEPDQAIFARTTDQRCYLVFRGTTTTLDEYVGCVGVDTQVFLSSFSFLVRRFPLSHAKQTHKLKYIDTVGNKT